MLYIFICFSTLAAFSKSNFISRLDLNQDMFGNSIDVQYSASLFKYNAKQQNYNSAAAAAITNSESTLKNGFKFDFDCSGTSDEYCKKLKNALNHVGIQISSELNIFKHIIVKVNVFSFCEKLRLCVDGNFKVIFLARN